MPDPVIAPAPSAPSKPAARRRRRRSTTAAQVPAKAAPATPARRRRSRKGGSLSRRGDFMGRAGLQQKAVATVGALAGSAILGGKTFNGIPQSLIASVALDYFGGDNAMVHDASTGMFVIGAVEWSLLNSIRGGLESYNKMIGPYLVAVAQEGGTAGTNAAAIANALGVKLTAGETGDTDFDAKVQRLAGRHAQGG